MNLGRLRPAVAAALLVAGMARSQEKRTPTPAPTPPDVEPILSEPDLGGYRRVTGETPTPTRTPTPPRNPRLVAALESSEDEDFERVALFDDGTLMLVQKYRGRGVPRSKALAPSEVDVVRRVVREALLVPASRAGGLERSVADLHGRKVRLEVAEDGGGVRIFTTEDLAQLPLAVGRAKGALEDLRARFFKSDPKETAWDPSGVKTGDLLRHRIYGNWFRVVRDDSFEQSLELVELSDVGARMLVARGQLPPLFESPALAGPTPTPAGR